MPHFTVQPDHNIQHNGKTYAEGAKVELSDEHAEPLLALGVIEPAGKAAKAKPAPAAPAGEADTAAEPAAE